MRFKMKKRIDLGNSLDDTDVASDIISQEESIRSPVQAQVHANAYAHTRAVSTFNNNTHDSKITQPEWSDPWSSDPWKNRPWGDPTNINQSRVESSFESLQFTPVLKTTGEESDILEIADAFGVPFGPVDAHKTSKRGNPRAALPRLNKDDKLSVGVVVKERLSILFDETTSDDPSCKVVGSIFAKSPNRKINSFCLTIRDSRAHVEHWDEKKSLCRNITASVPHLALDPGDQVFSISLNNSDHQITIGLDVPVINYSCIPGLKPIPMLFKTKSHRKNNRCQLGIRVRANPQNNYILRDIIILVIVPPELDGENITMSRRGGVWDEMKRTLAWNITKLEPGVIIDIQAQFRITSEGGSDESKFPLLARCSSDISFSKIDFNTEYSEDGLGTVDLDLDRTATILYRKI